MSGIRLREADLARAEFPGGSSTRPVVLKQMPLPLNIFVHSASECLTDHLPHGDGLICHALFRALLDRGHSIWATTKHHGVKDVHPNLTIVQITPSAPAHTLHSFEYNLRIDRQFRSWCSAGVRFDLAWRLHPYGVGCAICPAVGKLPLAIGPIYYDWPGGRSPRSRFGVTIRPLLAPMARLG